MGQNSEDIFFFPLFAIITATKGLDLMNDGAVDAIGKIDR
jgi:hypothetical protein